MEHYIRKPNIRRDDGISREDNPCHKYRKARLFSGCSCLYTPGAFQAASTLAVRLLSAEDSATLKSWIGVTQQLSKQAGVSL